LVLLDWFIHGDYQYVFYSYNNGDAAMFGGFALEEGIGGRLVPNDSSLIVWKWFYGDEAGVEAEYADTIQKIKDQVMNGAGQSLYSYKYRLFSIPVEPDIGPDENPLTESVNDNAIHGRFRISYRWDDANPANDVVHQIIIVHSEMDQNDRMWCVYKDDPSNAENDPAFYMVSDNDVSDYYKIGYFDCMEGIGGRQTLDLSEFYTTDGEGDDFGPTLLYYRSLEEAIQHMPKGITILDWPRWQVERL
jgi:hypothetical protein